MIEVHPDRLQQLVNRFCIQHFDLPFEALAIDGKVLCGSKGADHRQTRIMNAIGHDSGFCHAQKKVGTLPVEGSDEEKQSNEIKFFAPTLEQIDIAGRTITADAMNTQIESANHVVERGADFHFSVKGNQPGLLEDIQVWHEQEGQFQEPDFEEGLEKEHGRITQRKIWTTDRLNGHVKFPHVQQVFVIERNVQDPKGKNPDRVEIVYGITSLSKEESSAEEILTTNRGHWAVDSSPSCIGQSAGLP